MPELLRRRSQRWSATSPIRAALNRQSSAKDKRLKASKTAVASLDDRAMEAKEELRNLVLRVVAKLGLVLTLATGADSQPRESLDHEQQEAVLRAVLTETQSSASLERLQPDIANYLADLEPPATLTPDEFAGVYRRFLSLAEQRSLLRASAVNLDATELVLTGGAAQQLVSGGDSLVAAAVQQCLCLAAVTLHNGTLHNGTLTTLARTLQGRLTHLDLSGSRGFDDLGFKALAAYSPQLECLRMAGCFTISEDALRTVLKHCTCLRELQVTAGEVSDATLALAPSKCVVSKLEVARPPPAAAPPAEHRRGRSRALRGSKEHATGTDLPPAAHIVHRATDLEEPSMSVLAGPALSKPYAMRDAKDVPEEVIFAAEWNAAAVGRARTRTRTKSDQTGARLQRLWNATTLIRASMRLSSRSDVLRRRSGRARHSQSKVAPEATAPPAAPDALSGATDWLHRQQQQDQDRQQGNALALPPPKPMRVSTKNRWSSDSDAWSERESTFGRGSFFSRLSGNRTSRVSRASSRVSAGSSGSVDEFREGESPR